MIAHELKHPSQASVSRPIEVTSTELMAKHHEAPSAHSATVLQSASPQPAPVFRSALPGWESGLASKSPIIRYPNRVCCNQ